MRPVTLARSLRKRLTPQEVKLWLHLRALKAQGFHFRKQAPLGRYIVDFACLRQRLVVEVDGNQHGEDEGLARDAVREAALAAEGYTILRFTNAEVDRETLAVVDTIFMALTKDAGRQPR